MTQSNGLEGKPPVPVESGGRRAALGFIFVTVLLDMLGLVAEEDADTAAPEVS